MKEWLKRVILLTAVLTLSAIGASVLLPVSAEAFSATEEVIATDAFGGTDLAFTVENEFDDIYEFAIGNSEARQAGVNLTADSAPGSLVYGALAFKRDDQWQTWVGDSFRSLAWMDDPNSGFGDYNYAFLFTSWNGGAYTGFLETGFTDGYFGVTGSGAQSPVAAFSYSQGTINGGEALLVAPVPEPSTMILLGLGLMGLSGIARKRKR